MPKTEKNVFFYQYLEALDTFSQNYRSMKQEVNKQIVILDIAVQYGR